MTSPEMLSRFIEIVDVLIDRGDYANASRMAEENGIDIHAFRNFLHQKTEGRFKVAWLKILVRHDINLYWWVTGKGGKFDK